MNRFLWLGAIVAEQSEGGRISGRSELGLRLAQLQPRDGGRSYRLSTTAARERARGTKGRDAKTVGATTAVGAVLGAVIDGKDGAVKGGVIGAASGGAIVLGTRGESVRLPAGTALTFELTEPLRLPALD